MKKIIDAIVKVIRTIFGYGIAAALFAGGLTVFAYIAALIIGGDTATAICDFTYKTIFPIIIKFSTIMILLGLVCMYLCGEKSLTPSEKKKKITKEGDAKDTDD